MDRYLTHLDGHEEKGGNPMTKTYYAKIKPRGVGTTMPVAVSAKSGTDAKKIIEGQYGRGVTYEQPDCGRHASLMVRVAKLKPTHHNISHWT